MGVEVQELVWVGCSGHVTRCNSVLFFLLDDY